MMRFSRILIGIMLVLAGLPNVRAQNSEGNFDADLLLFDLRMPGYLMTGANVRVYATVENPSAKDLMGVVKFYDERAQEFISLDQPVSVLKNGGKDDVFVDWKPRSLGDHAVSARLVPWNSEGDDPSNNKKTVSTFVDKDSDGDGIGDREDPDDDNDTLPDLDDAFPFDPSESADADSDGLGDNADTDDDNDSVEDSADMFPLDPAEWMNTDGDGTGDNADAFPFDPSESADADSDGLGDNADPNDSNKGPVLVVSSAPRVIETEQPVSFHALESFDPDGELTSFEWWFERVQDIDPPPQGNAEMMQAALPPAGSPQHTGVLADPVFKKTGLWQITVRATDNSGESRTAQFRVTVVYRWQTLALGILALLLFLLLVALLVRTVRVGRSPRPEDASEEAARRFTLRHDAETPSSKGASGRRRLK